MPKLGTFSGDEVCQILESHGVARQAPGSSRGTSQISQGARIFRIHLYILLCTMLYTHEIPAAKKKGSCLYNTQMLCEEPWSRHRAHQSALFTGRIHGRLRYKELG